MDNEGNGLRESLLSGKWLSNEDPTEEEIHETLINDNIENYGNRGYPIDLCIVGKIFKMGKVGYGQGKHIKLEGWKEYDGGRLVMKRSSGTLTTSDGVPLTLKLFALKQVVDLKREPVKLCIVRLLSDKALKRRANGSNPEKEKSTKRRKTAKSQPASSSLVKIKSQPLSPVSPDTVSRSPVHSPMNSPPPEDSTSPPNVQSVPVHYHSPLSSPMGSPVPSLMESPLPSLMESPLPYPMMESVPSLVGSTVPSFVGYPVAPSNEIPLPTASLGSLHIPVDISHPDTSPPLAQHEVSCGPPPIDLYQLPFDPQIEGDLDGDDFLRRLGLSLFSVSGSVSEGTNTSSLEQKALF